MSASASTVIKKDAKIRNEKKKIVDKKSAYAKLETFKYSFEIYNNKKVRYC